MGSNNGKFSNTIPQRDKLKINGKRFDKSLNRR